MHLIAYPRRPKYIPCVAPENETPVFASRRADDYPLVAVRTWKCKIRSRRHPMPRDAFSSSVWAATTLLLMARTPFQDHVPLARRRKNDWVRSISVELKLAAPNSEADIAREQNRRSCTDR